MRRRPGVSVNRTSTGRKEEWLRCLQCSFKKCFRRTYWAGEGACMPRPTSCPSGSGVAPSALPLAQPVPKGAVRREVFP